MFTMIKSDWDLTLFFTRPISAFLGVLTLVVWFFPLLAAFLEKARRKNSSPGGRGKSVGRRGD